MGMATLFARLAHLASKAVGAPLQWRKASHCSRLIGGRDLPSADPEGVCGCQKKEYRGSNASHNHFMRCLYAPIIGQLNRFHGVRVDHAGICDGKRKLRVTQFATHPRRLEPMAGAVQSPKRNRKTAETKDKKPGKLSDHCTCFFKC